MEENIERYGVLSSVEDSTSSYSFSNSSGETFTFEVHPLNIGKEQINEALDEIKNPNVWFISHKTSIIPPNEKQIQQALNEGLILTLSFDGTLIDNYGVRHRVFYNKDRGKYEISVSNVAKLIDKKIQVTRLNTSLIKVIQESDDPASLVSKLDNSTKELFNKLFLKMDEQEKRIIELEKRFG